MLKRRKERLILAMTVMIMAIVITGCGAGDEGKDASALVPKQLPANDVSDNPYMGNKESTVHNDHFNSDVTDTVMPLCMDAEVHTSLETLNKKAPPSVFYDDKQNAISQLLGGVAVTELDGDVITRKGSFVPSKDDKGQYMLQTSYTFVDEKGNIVAPTSHGHVIILKTKDKEGKILPTFKKIMDVDISAEAVKRLGKNIDTSLLSIVYDYQGNLWFVTGGFRIYPDRNPAGFLGYLSREYIEAAQQGETPSLKDNLFFHKLEKGGRG